MGDKGGCNVSAKEMGELAPHKSQEQEVPCGPVVINPPVNAGDMGWTPGVGTKIPCREATKATCCPRESVHHNERFHMTQW